MSPGRIAVVVVLQQPIVLVIPVAAVGVLAGAGVMTWRQIQYGRARLELEGPARRGDTMRGVITTSGSAWTAVDRNFEPTVEVIALRTFRGRGRRSRSTVVARATAETSAARDGNDMTFRFTGTIPVRDALAEVPGHVPDRRGLVLHSLNLATDRVNQSPLPALRGERGLVVPRGRVSVTELSESST